MRDVTFIRDRMEITNLLHSYAHHADNGERAAFADLFTDDATVDIGIPQVHDKPSLLTLMDTGDATPAQTRHVMTNLVFHDQHDRTATGALYFTLMSTDAGRLTPVVTGTYTFTAQATPAGWRISRWRAEMDGNPG